MKRRIRPRTDIPDWRDPEMPVLEHRAKVDTWTQQIVGRFMVEVSPDVAQYHAMERMWQGELHPHLNPSWRQDPLYFGKKGRP